MVMPGVELEIDNRVDSAGNPTGGSVSGVGFTIDWQDGPLPDVGRNGAFLIDVIAACIQRLEFFNSTDFRCRENSLAITKLEEAVHWLEERRRNREQRGVLGAHKP